MQTGGVTSIAENSASGAVVGVATAVDPDRTGSVTYSLTDNAGGRFAINSTTGQITVATVPCWTLKSTQATEWWCMRPIKAVNRLARL